MAMKRDSVTYRLATSGESEVLATMAKIGESGEGGAKRIAQAYQRDLRIAEASVERLQKRAETLKALGGSDLQRRIAATTGIMQSELGDTKSAEASMRSFVLAQDEMQRSRNRLIAQTDPLVAAQQRYNLIMAEAVELDRQGALSAGDLTQIHASARAELERYSGAAGDLTSRNGAMTAGFQQAGFQVSDFAVQIGGGTSAIRAASLQAPQFVQALSLMGQGADSSKGRFAAFTAFLSGPWGAALTVGVSILGVLATKYLESGDASEEAEAKSIDFSRGLNLMEKSAEGAKAAIDQLNQSIESQIALMDETLRRDVDLAQTQFEQAQTRLRHNQAELSRLTRADDSMLATLFPQFADPFAQKQIAAAELRDQIQRDRLLVEQLRPVLGKAAVAIGQRNVEELLDPYLKQLNEVDARMRELAELRARSAETDDDVLARATDENYLSQVAFEEQLLALKKERADIEERQAKAEERRRKAQREANSEAKAFTFGNPIAGAAKGAPFGQKRGDRRHGGVDIPVPVGTPVTAVGDGVVEFVGPKGNYGNTIVIRIDDRTQVLDAHLSRFAVEVGDAVKKGEIIGFSGGARGAPGAGNSTGPHLHHELRREGKPVDPFGSYSINEGMADVVRQLAQQEEELARQREQNVQSVRALVEAGDPLAALANKLNDELAEIDRLAGTTPGQGGIGSEQADILRGQARTRYRKARTELFGASFEDLAEEGDRQREQTRERLAFIDRTKSEQAIANRFLERELELVQASASERERQLAKLGLIIDLEEAGVLAGTAEYDLILKANDALEDKREKLTELNRVWNEQRRIGEDIIDTVLDPEGWEDWGDMALGLVRDLIREMLVLAAINPLKNKLYGTDYATVEAGGIFDFLGGIFGGKGGLATGTLSAAGGFYDVGEFGKERVYLPRGAQVHGAGATRRMDAGAQQAPVNYYDLRGAMVTERVYADMQRMADDAAARGAAQGTRDSIQAISELQQRTHGAFLAAGT
ncbi:peptidoglycan DD-metalloendopeptidase family protein [Citromicrobium bathyomarinum]|uniref:peptidoglycan DD-metalloendopeptidase family protein n=1 Tax=Citromicrobium bathyomarinum TaxID=72174 RepID=UPI00315A7017